MVLDSKRLVTGILAVCVLLLSLGLLAVPTWAQDAPPATTLTVNKTDSPDPVLIGEILRYNIDVTNTGDATATNVVLTDDLPEGTAFVSVSSDAGTCTAPDEGGSGTVTCNLGDIAVGSPATVTIEVRATQEGTVENTAIADGANTEPAQDTTRTRIGPNLVINKLDDPDPVSGVEQLLLYTLRVQNQENFTVFDVGVTDDLPLSQVDFVALDSNDFNCQINAGAVQCTDGVLGPGEIATVEIVVEPEVAGTIRNRADVFFNRALIDTDVEETTVQASAVTDEPDDPDGPGDTDDPGTNPGEDPGADPGDNGNADDQYDEDDVINVPNTDLPNTGGFPPLLAVGFFLVAGAGLGTALLRRRF